MAGGGASAVQGVSSNAAIALACRNAGLEINSIFLSSNC
jgi:hypothetical protein